MDELFLRHCCCPQVLYSLSQGNIRGHDAAMPDLLPVKYERLPASVNDRSSRLFHEQHAPTHIPFVNRAKSQRAVPVSASDFSQPECNAANPFDFAAIDEHLELSLRLRAAHQQHCAVNTTPRSDTDRLMI